MAKVKTPISNIHFIPIDYQAFEQSSNTYVQGEWKIKNYSEVDTHIIQLLRTYVHMGKCVHLDDFFSSNTNVGKDGSGYQYKCHIHCKDCGKEVVSIVSKTRLFDYIKGSYTYLCEQCQEKLEEQKRYQQDMEQYQRMKRMISSTEEYIEMYLDPKKSWKPKVKASTKYHELAYSDYVQYSEVRDYINNMPYSDFLETPYWKGISQYTKQLAHYKCQLCGSGKMLNTHHKTYEHHGEEHIRSVMQQDLIVLCENCHHKFHDKVED